MMNARGDHRSKLDFVFRIALGLSLFVRWQFDNIFTTAELSIIRHWAQSKGR
jgi:hypothetical protein